MILVVPDAVKHLATWLNALHLAWIQWYMRVFGQSFTQVLKIDLENNSMKPVYTRTYVEFFGTCALDLVNKVMPVQVDRFLQNCMRVPRNRRTFYFGTTGTGKQMLFQSEADARDPGLVNHKASVYLAINQGFDVSYLANVFVEPDIEWTALDMLKCHILIKNVPGSQLIRKLPIEHANLSMTHTDTFDSFVYKDTEIIDLYGRSGSKNGEE